MTARISEQDARRLSEKKMTDKQLIRYATQFRKGILAGRDSTGFCLMVSAPLATLLEMHGVVCKMVEGANCHHCFIELADGRILDPTADQFGLVPVYLGPRKDIHE